VRILAPPCKENRGRGRTRFPTNSSRTCACYLLYSDRPLMGEIIHSVLFRWEREGFVPSAPVWLADADGQTYACGSCHGRAVTTARDHMTTF
jgi:hypothetical protein